MEGAVVVAAEARVLVTVGVRDVVLKAEEEVSEGFSRLEVKLVNVKQGAGHTSSTWVCLAFMPFRGFCQ